MASLKTQKRRKIFHMSFDTREFAIAGTESADYADYTDSKEIIGAGTFI